MTRRRIFTIIISILFAGISSAQNRDYIWPLKLDPELTSRFCDYRAGHFHGGLDIRTGGRIGLPVYAIDDGYVFRATTSFKGYGKALYLRLNDGRIIVFGHLSGFFPALDNRIRDAQFKEKRYNQDLYFKSDEFPVVKGERIAFSGESGTGAPHLHFEMRSPNNNPINPLESGYRLPDKVPPEFDRLVIRYYDHGFAPGDPCQIEFIPIIYDKRNRIFTVADSIISSGDLALAVAGGDRVDGSGFFYGFYELRLLVDDSLVFQMKSDSLSYNTTRQLNYVRDLELIHLFSGNAKTDNDRGIFYRLYVPPHASQYFWPGFSDNAGIITNGRPGDRRKISVIALDESGNKSELRFYVETPELPRPLASHYQRNRDTLRIDILSTFNAKKVLVELRPEISQPFKGAKNSFTSKQASAASGPQFESDISLPAKMGEGRFFVRDRDNRNSPWIFFHAGVTDDKFKISGSPEFLKIDFSTSHLEPDLKITNEGDVIQLSMTADGFNHYSTGILDQYWSGPTKFEISSRNVAVFDTEINLNYVIPNKAAEIVSPDSTLIISVQSGSAYYPACVFPSKAQKTAISYGQAIIYDIQPDFMLVDTPLRLRFDLDKLGLNDPKIGAYGYAFGTGKWVFVAKVERGKLEMDAFGLGKVALIEDNTPPVISMVSPSGTTKSRHPLLSCRLEDTPSGLNLDGGLSMSFDGIWVPAEYDIDGGQFRYNVRNSLRPGKHQLEIKAADNQGNVAVKTIIFSVVSK